MKSRVGPADRIFRNSQAGAAATPIPGTLTTQTPRGGKHFYFKWTAGIRNTASKIASGVDTRGAGGYCILPPSRRGDGKTYDMICAVSELPEAPSWLVDLVVAKGEPTEAEPELTAFSKAAAKHLNGGGDSNEAYGRAALEAECAKLASVLPGTRNHMLNAAAFSLGQLVAGGVLHESEVRLRLRDAADACGLLKDDGGVAVMATMNSGLAAGMAKPRTGPGRTTSSVVATKARATHEKHGGVSLEDFYGYMPLHNYIFIPSRDLWPASSVNAIIGPLPVLDATGKSVLDKNGKPKMIKPSTWLDKNRRIEMMTWCPGESEVIADRLVAEGGWIDRIGCSTFNLYRPPTVAHGDPEKARPWLDHVHRVYGDDAGHIILWLAHRAQRPQEKINHALVLGGLQGIGKDTLLEPAKHTVGPWNFIEVSPQHLLGRFNGFVKSVILRVNEARDLGDVNRFSFYDHMKAYTAAPPDVLRVDEKHLREYSVFNVCGVIITTNHKADGIFLPADD